MKPRFWILLIVLSYLMGMWTATRIPIVHEFFWLL
jgi:hypothetical protein